jgi:hypothetical protein
MKERKKMGGKAEKPSQIMSLIEMNLSKLV